MAQVIMAYFECPDCKEIFNIKMPNGLSKEIVYRQFLTIHYAQAHQEKGL